LPDQLPTMSFRLPSGETAEVYLVRLPSGRVVSRTREELEELPAGERGQIIGPAPAQPKGGTP
jgi:hypothetical protein